MNIKIIILRKRNQTQDCLMPNSFIQHNYIYELYIYIQYNIWWYFVMEAQKTNTKDSMCLLKLVKLHLKQGMIIVEAVQVHTGKEFPDNISEGGEFSNNKEQR